jgi:TetR/AcrR family transcriptional repressor of nem operon
MKALTLPFDTSSKSRGRPREFDMDEAVDKAIPVFCERGFHGTSINDLADAMQLTVGSIYKAFKDKRGVFLAAVDREASLRDARLRRTLHAAKSGRDKVHAALMFYVELSHGAAGIQGCLTISTAVDLTISDPEIAERAADVFRRREAHIAELLAQGQADGSIAENIDGEGTARMMLCLLQGLRVVGKTGRTRKDLMAVIEAAMKTLD